MLTVELCEAIIKKLPKKWIAPGLPRPVFAGRGARAGVLFCTDVDDWLATQGFVLDALQVAGNDLGVLKQYMRAVQRVGWGELAVASCHLLDADATPAIEYDELSYAEYALIAMRFLVLYANV